MSLPTRERGLKQRTALVCLCRPWSLPTRERGLKPKHLKELNSDILSLPTRERGLKQLRRLSDSGIYGRSLHGSVD